MTGEARRGLWGGVRGSRWEGWIVGACGAIQSSWPVSWLAGGKVFDVWSVAESWARGRSGTEKGEIFAADGLGGFESSGV